MHWIHSLDFGVGLPTLRLQNENPVKLQHSINALEKLDQSTIAVMNVDPLGKREPINN